MSLLDKLLGKEQPVPGWASFFSRREMDRFLALVDEELKRRGVAYTLADDASGAHLTESEQEGSVLGLMNVAQRCHGAEKADWPEVVHDHFERVLVTAKSTADLLDSLGSSLEQAKPLLKVRLYPAGMSGLEVAVTDSPAEGIVATLVYDLPDSVAMVHKDHFKAWGVSKPDIFRLAMENVHREEGIDRQELGVEAGCKLNALMGDSFFTASHALFLEEHLPQPLPEMGALVAIPTRHLVVYHPITDASALNALQAMLPMAIGVFQDGPGSVSPSVYWWREAAWWHEGQFTRIPAEIEGKKLQVYPPNEFIEKVLKPLSEP